MAAPRPFHFILLLALCCFSFLVSSTTARSAAKTTPSENSPSADQPTGQKLWCVAKPSAPEEILTANLNFACGEGGADCSQLQSGGACYSPNTIIAHASYAMNLYYQSHGRNWWNCYFQNSGLVVFTDPSYGGCTYPPK